nr:hypothetical protein Iba_chr06dCG2150 [Ipomoea batatas]
MTTCSSSSAARLDPEPRLGCLGTWSVPVRGMDRAVGRSFSICRSLTITFARLALEEKRIVGQSGSTSSESRSSSSMESVSASSGREANRNGAASDPLPTTESR